MVDQSGHGKVEMLGAQLGQMFEQHRNAEPDRESLILEQLPGPGEVARLLADHGDDVVDMAHGEEVGDDPSQLVVAHLGGGGMWRGSISHGPLFAIFFSPYHGDDKVAIREWLGRRLDTGFVPE